MQNYRRQRLGACLSLTLIVVAGCQGLTGPGPEPRDPEYAFGFYNATDQTLDDVQITWPPGADTRNAGAGILSPDWNKGGGGKVDHFEPGPIPERVTLRWRDPGGVKRERVVELPAAVASSPSFTGTIYFKYSGEREGGTWYVVPMTKDQIERLAEQRQPIIPPDPPQDLPGTRPGRTDAPEPG